MQERLMQRRAAFVENRCCGSVSAKCRSRDLSNARDLRSGGCAVRVLPVLIAAYYCSYSSLELLGPRP